VNRGFPYSTRIDRVIMTDIGPVIMEIKTASRRSKDLLSGYRMDSQFLGQQYCWRYSKFYRKYGPLQGYMVDLAVKTNEMVFVREKVPVDYRAMREWEKQKRWSYSQMVMCEINNYWPKVRANCVKYGRCPLTDHCASLKKNFFPRWEKKKPEDY